MSDASTSDASTSSFTLPDDHYSSIEGSTPPHIVHFSGKNSDGVQAEQSLQSVKGKPVTLAWEIQGQVDELSIDGASSSPATSATSVSDTPQADVTYVLHVKNQYGEHQLSLVVALHDEGEAVSSHIDVAPQATGAIALVAGDDVVIDPPVRLLPQWPPPPRYGRRQLAGKDGNPCVWQDSGCGPSSAATILRWFAEDCKAGNIPFPTKDGSKIDPTFYGPRMAEALWPDGFKYYKGDAPGNPIGKVELDNSGVDNAQLQNKAAKLLGKDKAFRVTNTPKGGWLAQIRELLKVGPVIVGIGPPSPHGHYIVAHGVKGGALLIANPGNVLYAAWKGQAGFKTSQYMPAKTQWKNGVPKDSYEDDVRAYGEVSGALLTKLLDGLKSVTSLTYPGGPVLSGGAVAEASASDSTPAPDAQPAQADAAPLGDPSCDQCTALQKLVGNGVEGKIKKGGKDSDCIKLLQSHLLQFGYDMGKSGVDGDFGGMTSAALKLFLGEAGVSAGTDALNDDAAKAVLAQHKAGFKTGGAAKPADPAPAATPDAAAQPGGDLEQFFTYKGNVGEGKKKRDYTYKSYRVKGNTPWFMRGRYMVDFDGAPNCYGKPDGTTKVLPIAQYPTVDIMSWTGALDSLADAKNNDGTWAAVILDKSGQPVKQKDSDPFPGFCIATVPLQDGTKAGSDPARYADSRVIPFFAMPAQILAQKGVWYTDVGGGHSGNFGDYVTAVNTKTMAYGHAVVGDTGNKPEFGEGSYALGKSIGLLTGDFEPDVLYIVYPASGEGKMKIPDPDALRQKGEDLFKTFGGMDEVNRVLKLMG